jgi:hypothetical protein
METVSVTGWIRCSAQREKHNMGIAERGCEEGGPNRDANTSEF